MAKDKFMFALNKLKCCNLDFTDKKRGFCLVLLGIAATLVLSLFANNYQWTITWLWGVLALGVVVGLLNMFHKESIVFLVAALSFTFTLAIVFMLQLASKTPLLPVGVMNSLQALMYFLAPIVILVSLKVFYALAAKK